MEVVFHYWVSCENMKHWPKVSQLSGRSKCTYTGDSTSTVQRLTLSKEGWPQTHYSTCQTSRQTGLCQFCALCITHCHLGLKWRKRRRMERLSEANCHACITLDLWQPNSPNFNPVDYKFSNESTRRKCRMWMLWGTCDWCVGCKETEMNPLTSGAVHLSQRKTFWIFNMIFINQNILNCNKLNKQTHLTALIPG